MAVSPGSKILLWLSVSVYRFGRFDKKRLRLACFPFNIWIVLDCWRVLWLVNVVFFGGRGIQICRFFDLSFHKSGFFTSNVSITSLIVISLCCAFAFCFCRSISMTLTVMTSVAAALSWYFAILVNKICKIMRIFERLDHLRNRWVLCQHYVI